MFICKFLLVCVFRAHLSGVQSELVAKSEKCYNMAGALELDSVATPELIISTRSNSVRVSRVRRHIQTSFRLYMDIVSDGLELRCTKCGEGVPIIRAWKEWDGGSFFGVHSRISPSLKQCTRNGRSS